MYKPVKKNSLITAVVANSKGEIFELEGYGAVGMAGSALTPLTTEDTINMPFGSELMFLPDRKPILFNAVSDRIETLIENPFVSGEKIFPVAAFNSPGYVTSYISAYEEEKDAGYLPLFSYGAAGWQNGKFRSTAILVDAEKPGFATYEARRCSRRGLQVKKENAF